MNADTLFQSTNMKAFQLKVDETVYAACLDGDARAPFKIIPGDNPTMEMALEVYSDSIDAIYRGKYFELITT